MSIISFELDPSSDLEKSLVQKIDDGCALLQRVFGDQEFKRWVAKFQWQTNDGQTFRRFYHSCGRKNDQVYDSLVKGLSWDEIHKGEDSLSRVFNVAVCKSKEEYREYSNLKDTICLDMRYLDKTSYTPIHLAAALCQEYCIHLGYPPRGNDMNECWSKFTVPVAIARIVRDVTVILAKDDFYILQWCMLNDTFQFDYQPCSFTYGIQQIGEDIYNSKNANHLQSDDDRLGQVSHDGNFTILTSLPN